MFRKIKYIFSRKRKQCVNCKKTFYKPDKTLIIIGHTLDIEVSVCPYCGESYIIV